LEHQARSFETTGRISTNHCQPRCRRTVAGLGLPGRRSM